MKDTLKRMLGLIPAPAEAETVKEDVKMEVTEATVAALVADTSVADLASMTASFNAVTELFAASQVQVTELTAALAGFTASKDAADALALATKLDARKALVVAAVGTEKADAFMSATSAMADTTFDAVMAAMSTSSKVEAATLAFQEVGIDAEADMALVAAEAESNPTMDYLKAKYAHKA